MILVNCKEVDMSSHKNSKVFIKAFEEGADANTLLKHLEITIDKIVGTVLHKFKKVVNYVDEDDTKQDVRIRLWHVIDDKHYLNNMNGEDAYKYIVAVISDWTVRTVVRVSKKNKHEQNSITLSILDIDRLNNETEISSSVYVNRLRDSIKDVHNGEKVLDFLTSGEVIDETKYAGLPINDYYATIAVIRERVKEIV